MTRAYRGRSDAVASARERFNFDPSTCIDLDDEDNDNNHYQPQLVGATVSDEEEEEGTEGTADEHDIAFLSAPSSADHDIAENIPSSMTSVESGKSKRGSPSLSNYPIYCSVNTTNKRS